MKIFLAVILFVGMMIPVHASQITAPPVTGEAENLMPSEMPSFGEGLVHILKTAVKSIRPDLVSSCRLCLAVVGIAMLVSILNSFSGKVGDLGDLAGVLGISVLLFGTTNTLIHVASDTVQEISNYGKLLLPVMTAAVAAQGGTVSSGALYTGTAFFDALLSSVISVLLATC